MSDSSESGSDAGDDQAQILKHVKSSRKYAKKAFKQSESIVVEIRKILSNDYLVWRTNMRLLIFLI